MADKVNYIFVRDVANYKEGETKEFDKVPVGLQAHVRPVKGYEAKAQPEVDTKAVADEALAQVKAAIGEAFEAVVGKKAGNSGIETMLKGIVEANAKLKADAEGKAEK